MGMRQRVLIARVLGRTRPINSILSLFYRQRSSYSGGVLLSYAPEFASADRGCRPNQFGPCEVYSCALWLSSCTSPPLLEWDDVLHLLGTTQMSRAVSSGLIIGHERTC